MATVAALACSPSPKLLAMVEPVGGFPQPQPPLNGTTQLQPSGIDPRKLKVEPEEQGPIGALHGTQLQQIQQLPPASFAYQAPVAKAAGGLGAPLLGPVSGAEVRGQGLEGEEAAVAVEGVHLGAREVEFVCQLVAGQPGVFRAQVHALTTPQAGGFLGTSPPPRHAVCFDAGTAALTTSPADGFAARPPLNMLSALILMLLPGHSHSSSLRSLAALRLKKAGLSRYVVTG